MNSSFCVLIVTKNILMQFVKKNKLFIKMTF